MYADCLSTEEKNPSPRYDTGCHLIMRLHSSRFVVMGILFYLQLPPDPLWPLVVVLARTPPMAQVEILNLLLCLKPFNGSQINNSHSLEIFVNKQYLKRFISQSAVAAELTDCISAGGWDSSKLFPSYDTKQSDDESSIKRKVKT